MEIIWKMRERIEREFTKDDITNVPRETLQAIIADVYAELCLLTDSRVAWWEKDEDAIEELRQRIIKSK